MGISVVIPALTEPKVRRGDLETPLAVTLTGALKAINEIIAPAGKMIRFVDGNTVELIALSDAVASLFDAATIPDFVAALGTIPASALPERQAVKIIAAGDIVADPTKREIQIAKTASAVTTVSVGTPASRANLPLTIADLKKVFGTYPTTIVLTDGAQFPDGSTSLVMDSDGQVGTLWPIADGSGYYFA